MSTSSGGADAMTGLATGKKIDRPQEIHTPECILAVCRATFGGEIELDPCSSMQRQIAKTTWFGPHCFTEWSRGTDGLLEPWMSGTYVNPPYKDLKQWMAKSANESVLHILLAPVRTHRGWWVEYRNQDTLTALLKPLKFEGYPQAFPAPLALHLRNANTQEQNRFHNACIALVTGFL